MVEILKYIAITAFIFWSVFCIANAFIKANLISTAIAFITTSTSTSIAVWLQTESIDVFESASAPYLFLSLLYFYGWIIVEYRFIKGSENINISDQNAICCFMFGVFTFLAWLNPYFGFVVVVTGGCFALFGIPSSKKKILYTGALLIFVGFQLTNLNLALDPHHFSGDEIEQRSQEESNNHGQ